tara:strand:+ start:295 stop:534 length:240 start_codon:yes stop_codon:yes gene_type:complete
MTSISKIRWQCRRGMRELDELLSGYLESSYQKISNEEKKAFNKLLELSDPELVKLLLTPYQSEDPQVNDMIKKIKKLKL